MTSAVTVGRHSARIVNSHRMQVLEVSDTFIAVNKARDRRQLDRNDKTKVAGNLMVGGEVTLPYRMVATDVEVN